MIVALLQTLKKELITDLNKSTWVRRPPKIDLYMLDDRLVTFYQLRAEIPQAVKNTA